MLFTLKLNWLAVPAVLAAVCFANPAVAKNVHSWVTDDGVYSFTDDTKKIPRQYRLQAKKQTLRRLARYERYTPSDRRGDGSHVDRLPAHLENLRAANTSPTQTAPAAQAAAGNALLIRQGGRDGGGVDIAIALEPGAAPVEVEELRLKASRGTATRTVTVVRQDGEVIAIIKPSLHNRKTDQGNEADLSDL